MQTDDINNTLINACVAGCVEMVTVLLDFGADVNYIDEVKLQKSH
jgi:ankyrin repeat protein